MCGLITMYPSYFAQMFTGFLIFYVILMMIYRMNNSSESHFNEDVIVLLLAIAVGVHGLQHACAEVNFDFDPLNDKWHYRLGKEDKKRLVKKLTE